MSNRFRDIEEEEDELAPDLQPELKRQRNFFTALFTEGVMSKQAATDMLPYIIYVAFLGMIYIGNRHLAENNIRDIDKLSKEVKELSWDFKTLKADLMLKSTQTEVAKLVDTLGLKEPAEPPKKILVASDEY